MKAHLRITISYSLVTLGLLGVYLLLSYRMAGPLSAGALAVTIAGVLGLYREAARGLRMEEEAVKYRVVRRAVVEAVHVGAQVVAVPSLLVALDDEKTTRLYAQLRSEEEELWRARMRRGEVSER